MAIESGTGVVGGGSLAARPLGRALQLPPSFELTRGDEAAAGQEFGATFEIDEISRTFGVDAGDCSAGSAKKDWFEYSTSSNRGPGAGLDNALTSHGGLSEVSSTFATPNNLANDPNSDICTNYNWPTELELGSFNDYLLFDDMTLSQDLTPLGFPQFDNNLVLDMPSLISESEICGSLSLCNATDHGFGSMTAIGQGFKSLESTTDDLLPYECPSPSQPLTGLSRLPDSSQYPLYANTNLALSPQPSVAPRLEPPTANGNR
jgi:hypothetical protein